MTYLEILQLVSPALPVGAFSYSEGFEFLAQTNKISNESHIFNWLEAELLRGKLRVEAASLSPLMDCLNEWQREKNQKSKLIVFQWDQWLMASKDSLEIRTQQKQMGKSLLQLLSDLDHPLPGKEKNLSWPVAWAWAGVSWSLPKYEVIQGYLYGWISNQISASLRLLPLGPNKVQGVQHKLLPLITKQSEILLNQDPRKIWTGDIGAIMAQQSHAELYSRLFRS